MKTTEPDSSKREFIKKSIYVAPAVLSLQALSAVAKAGSEKGDERDIERDDDHGHDNTGRRRRRRRRSRAAR
jgi:hypothetical protein